MSEDRLAEQADVVLREEWRSVVTLRDGGGVGYHHHASRDDAEHFKTWRESLHGEHDGMIWPPVDITLEQRYVTEWRPA